MSSEQPYEKPMLGEFRSQPDHKALERDMAVTGADMAPFVKSHPDALLLVRIGNRLVAVTDVYYDNDLGCFVIETEDEPERPE